MGGFLVAEMMVFHDPTSQGAEMTDGFPWDETVALYRTTDPWMVGLLWCMSYPPGNDHISPPKNGILKMMIFRTSRSVGYVSIPWRSTNLFKTPKNSTHNFSKGFLYNCFFNDFADQATSAYAEASIASGFVRCGRCWGSWWIVFGNKEWTKPCGSY